jgi:hypothetical protein
VTFLVSTRLRHIFQAKSNAQVSPWGLLDTVSTDDDVALSHCDPPAACMRWDMRPVILRIVNWAANVSRGATDLQQTLTQAKFIPGSTIGPVSRAARL